MRCARCCRLAFLAALIVVSCYGAIQAVFASDDAGNLTALMRERRDTLRLRFDLVEKMQSSGLRSNHSVIRAENDLLNAELTLANTRGERIALHKKLVGNLKKLEQSLSVEVKQGAAEVDNHLMVKAERLDAEIQLARATEKD